MNIIIIKPDHPGPRCAPDVPEDVVWVRDEIELEASGKPRDHAIASVWLSHGDGQNLVQIVSIIYHGGKQIWAMEVEHSIQRANEYHTGTLREVIKMFESRLGLTLPEIKVIQAGVGVYSAQSSYASDNPFALQDGGVYRVRDKKTGAREFIVEKKFDQDRIRFVKDDLSLSETFEPRIVLSVDDWKSLTKVR